MALPENIYLLRTNARLSREKLAEILNVSHQAVQKWESGTSTPDIKNIIRIAKYFGVSMDALLLDCDSRLAEERKTSVEIRPKYANLHEWEDYSGQLSVEYVQSMEEGRDIERYKDLFDAVSQMPAGNLRTRMADVIFDLVQQAGQRPGYAYLEPSVLEEIQALRKPFHFRKQEPDEETLKQKIHGAWL
ncbi:MAG: helix-turn-helix domain-containing protein, partial [Firmicutes bacterium]|nr:helix-turn-helix domain-containing protein [Bacillota bacterium]